MNKIYKILGLFVVAFSAVIANATWVYTEEVGSHDSQPYSGYISDGNWKLYVYQPDASSQDFWLGCGGKGSTKSYSAGSGTLDLSTLEADTGIRVVNISQKFMHRKQGTLTGLVVPNTLTNITALAFEQVSLTSLDLSNTQIKSIGAFAFAWNSSLSEVWLPETLEYLGKCAFRTMPSKVTIHFAGDVPFLEEPTNSYGSGFNAYVSHVEYQNVFGGGSNYQWAFAVNAEKYPNWKRIGKATYYTDENPFPTAENNWIPNPVNYTKDSNYSAPFGNTWFSRTSDTSVNGRSYLIQEGTSDGTTIARPMLGAIEIAQNRYSIDFAIPYYVGTGANVTGVLTLGDQKKTFTLTEDGVLEVTFDDLPESTSYDWSFSLTSSDGYDFVDGSTATVTPDVVIENPVYVPEKSGVEGTFSIDVTALVVESATLEIKINDEIFKTETITELGTYSYTKDDFVLGETYTITFTATGGVDVDVKTVEFFAKRYKWTYTPGEGKSGAYPYSGIIADDNWELYVYQPDPNSNDFWLGTGNNGTWGQGSAAYITGSGELDLTQLLDDTTGDGTPVRLVNVASNAFRRKKGTITSLILPEAVTNVSRAAFEECSFTSLDFSNTRIESIEGASFCWNQSLTKVVFPKTLKRIGPMAFRNAAAGSVFHFLGDVPTIEPTTDKSICSFGPYVSEGEDVYETFYLGRGNQNAFCVDTRLYPNWATLSDTTWYTEENPFPTSENNWIPSAVRYTTNSDYKAPLGTTKFGRSTDDFANGRTYIIYEKHGDIAFMLLVF